MKEAFQFLLNASRCHCDLLRPFSRLPNQNLNSSLSPHQITPISIASALLRIAVCGQLRSCILGLRAAALMLQIAFSESAEDEGVGPGGLSPSR
jgi:hypothetical protein